MSHCAIVAREFGIPAVVGTDQATSRIPDGARILVDGRQVWEKKNVKAGPVSAPAILDIAGHKSLTLEVDYGENYDVQDRFNWIEPALLRTRPAAAPSTQPQ